MYHTKRVHPDDDPVLRSKDVAPLNTCMLSCVDSYYVITRLKKNRMSNIKIIIIVSKQLPVTQIIPFLLHTFYISCCLVSLVSSRIRTAYLPQQKTWESFQQPLLFVPNARALASRCCHSPGTELPLTVSR